MAGIPNRGIPTTYPAPPLEFAANGLSGLRPAMPVPCKRETFSSSVISFNTSAALSSGERLLLIQGAGGFLCSEPACAKAGKSARLRIAMPSASGFVRSERRYEFIVPPLCVLVSIPLSRQRVGRVRCQNKVRHRVDHVLVFEPQKRPIVFEFRVVRLHDHHSRDHAAWNEGIICPVVAITDEF